MTNVAVDDRQSPAEPPVKQRPGIVFDAAAEAEGLRLRALRAGIYRLIDRYEWTHFAHLTFASPATAAGATIEFEKRFIRRLERRLNGKVGWCRILDRGTSNILHIHALLHLPTSWAPHEIAIRWTAGRQKVVQPYDPEGRGIAYVAMKTTLGGLLWEGEVEFSPLPTLRHRTGVAVGGGRKSDSSGG